MRTIFLHKVLQAALEGYHSESAWNVTICFILVSSLTKYTAAYDMFYETKKTRIKYKENCKYLKKINFTWQVIFPWARIQRIIPRLQLLNIFQWFAHVYYLSPSLTVFNGCLCVRLDIQDGKRACISASTTDSVL